MASRTAYDDKDRVVSQTTPAGGSTTATPATRVTVYYSVAANSSHPSCGSKPEWAGLVCLTKVGGQAASGPELPTTTTTYDRYDHVASTTETTSAGTLRTTTMTHDSAGRLITTSVSAPTLGEPLQTRRVVYDPMTGEIVKSQTVDTGGNVTAEIVRSYDTLGRPTSYKDADGNLSTFTYDILSRPVVTTDGKATRTYIYDEGTERRGLATSVQDSETGTISATYDADGNLITQQWPNGVRVTHTYNEVGNPTTISYTQPGCGQADCTLYTETVKYGVHGQVMSRLSSVSAQTYGYDNVGRLTSVADTVSGQCTTRLSIFDTATNRTATTTYAPAIDGACQTSTPANSTLWTYDTASRISTTAYGYDALGRTSAMPGQDSANPAGGLVTLSYHSNDMARTISQGSRTATYSVDVAPTRMRTWTDNGSGTAITRTHHYSNDGDVPAWTDEGNGGQHTRPIAALGRVVAFHTPTDGIAWALTNTRGDIIAGMPTSGFGLSYTSEHDEYGLPRNSAQAGTQRYGWLGNTLRAADTPGGLTLMGARVYAPGSGRFLSTDPIYGGGANPYSYASGDPIGKSDPTGLSDWFNFWAPSICRVTWRFPRVGNMQWTQRQRVLYESPRWFDAELSWFDTIIDDWNPSMSISKAEALVRTSQIEKCKCTIVKKQGRFYTVRYEYRTWVLWQAKFRITYRLKFTKWNVLRKTLPWANYAASDYQSKRGTYIYYHA